MLHWCEERNRQQQCSQCLDAAGGLWVCRAASRDKGMAWTWEKQRWQARSNPNGQPEGRKWGWGEPPGLQAPEGSLPAHRPRNSRCQSPAQLPDLPPALTLPSINRPQAWGPHILFPTTQYKACGPSLLPGPPQLTRVQVSLYSDGNGGRGGGGGCAQRNLSPEDQFTPAEGSEYGTDRIREMGSLMSRPTSPAPTQWVLPFALTLPNLPLQSTAPSWGRGGRRSLPSPPISPPSNGGDGTPGPYTGSPGPSTPSLGPVATPGRADVGAPREA